MHKVLSPAKQSTSEGPSDFPDRRLSQVPFRCVQHIRDQLHTIHQALVYHRVDGCGIPSPMVLCYSDDSSRRSASIAQTVGRNFGVWSCFCHRDVGGTERGRATFQRQLEVDHLYAGLKGRIRFGFPTVFVHLGGDDRSDPSWFRTARGRRSRSYLGFATCAHIGCADDVRSYFVRRQFRTITASRESCYRAGSTPPCRSVPRVLHHGTSSFADGYPGIRLATPVCGRRYR